MFIFVSICISRIEAVLLDDKWTNGDDSYLVSRWNLFSNSSEADEDEKNFISSCFKILLLEFYFRRNGKVLSWQSVDLSSSATVSLPIIELITWICFFLQPYAPVTTNTLLY